MQFCMLSGRWQSFILSISFSPCRLGESLLMTIMIPILGNMFYLLIVLRCSTLPNYAGLVVLSRYLHAINILWHSVSGPIGELQLFSLGFIVHVFLIYTQELSFS